MKKMTTEEFIEKARLKHDDKYDYSLVDYKNANKKIKIICPIHGPFEQFPREHLKGNCFRCSKDKLLSNTKDFIEKANKVHGDRYDYSLVE